MIDLPVKFEVSSLNRSPDIEGSQNSKSILPSAVNLSVKFDANNLRR